MGRDGLSVVEKIAAILSCFVDARAEALSFNEIFSATPMTRTTVHRLLSDLTASGILAQDGHGDRYRLGPLVLMAGSLAQEHTSAAERAMRAMQVLRDQFGETTVVAELHGDTVVPVRRVDGVFEMRMNQELGRGYPAYAGATGKVLLAHSSADRQAAYLASVRLEPLTDATVTDVDALRRELEEIRRIGAAVSRGERVMEAVAISAPIFNDRLELECALTVSGVASRFDSGRLMAAAQAVKAQAERVSRDLGWRPSPGIPTSADLEEPGSDAHVLLQKMCLAVWHA